MYGSAEDVEVAKHDPKKNENEDGAEATAAQPFRPNTCCRTT